MGDTDNVGPDRVIPLANGTTVTVYRTTTTTDRYGNEVPGPWAVSSVIDGCGMAPRSSSDVTDAGRQGVIVGFTLYAPHDADIGPHDRVEVDGDMFEVEGDIGRWASPFTGWAPGLEVALRKVEG